jgi:hypothetical protein
VLIPISQVEKWKIRHFRFGYESQNRLEAVNKLYLKISEVRVLLIKIVKCSYRVSTNIRYMYGTRMMRIDSYLFLFD